MNTATWRNHVRHPTPGNPLVDPYRGGPGHLRDLAGQHRGERGAALDPARPAPGHRRAGVGGQRLHPGLRRPAFGRRPLFLAGLAVFTGASLAAGLGGSGAMLIAARSAQGVGAALLAPTTLAIISTTFPRERERNLAVAAWSAIAALALALGPLAGGLLAQHWHWNWIFFINVPIGLATLAV